jgi:WXXGXW repeat (2 copies)
MRSFISAALLTLILAAGGSAFGAQVSIGIRIGPPPPPRVVYVVPRPAPEYVWIDGYWYIVKNRYRWHEGYWTLPPYARARWVGPRYEGEMYFVGYWDGDHGRIEHKHHKHGHGRGHDRDDDRD